MSEAGSAGAGALEELSGLQAELRTDPPATCSGLAGLRVVVVSDDPSIADVLAQELRSCDAEVALIDDRGRGARRARELDPHCVLLDTATLEMNGVTIAASLQNEPRLRWARVVHCDFSELFRRSARPDRKILSQVLAPCAREDRRLRGAAERHNDITISLASIGPARALRALADVADDVLRVHVETTRARLYVDMSGELIVGADFQDLRTDRHLEGTSALAAFMAVRAGEAWLERREHAKRLDIMAPTQEAMEAAQREMPWVAEDLPTNEYGDDPPIDACEALRRSSRPPRNDMLEKPEEPTRRVHLDEISGDRRRSAERTQRTFEPKGILPTHALVASEPPPREMPRAARPAGIRAPLDTRPEPDDDLTVPYLLEGPDSGPAAEGFDLPAVPPVALPGSRPPPAGPNPSVGGFSGHRSSPPAPVTDADGPTSKFKSFPAPLMAQSAPVTIPKPAKLPSLGRPPTPRSDPPPATAPLSARSRSSRPPVAPPPSAGPPSRPPATRSNRPPTTRSSRPPATRSGRPPAPRSSRPPAPRSSLPPALRPSAPPVPDSAPPYPVGGLGALSTLPPPRPNRVGLMVAVASSAAIVGVALVAGLVIVYLPGDGVAPVGSAPVATAEAPVAPWPGQAPARVAAPAAAPTPTAPSPAAPSPAAPTPAAPSPAAPTPAPPTPTPLAIAPEPSSAPVAAPAPAPAAAPEPTPAPAAAPEPTPALAPGARGRGASDALLARARNAEHEAARFEILEQAIAADPRNPHAMSAMARYFIALGDGDNAVLWAEHAVRRRRRRARYRVVLGNALVVAGRPGEARRAYHVALRLDAGNGAARRGLAGL